MNRHQSRGLSLEEYDVLVAGAGTAGCLAAKTAAKAGLTVCVIDAKNRRDIGKKICGDAIGKHHFDRLALKEPTGDEVERVMEGVEIFSPDKQTSYVVKGESLYGYVLNRHAFGQRLVREASDAGAVLQDTTMVTEPLIEQGAVRGLHTKNMKTGEQKRIRSRIVMEATGFFAAIRKRLSPALNIDTHVANCDVEACYREIRQLEHSLEDPTLCQIYVTQAATPGGYYWIFPESGTNVNVGLGVAMLEKFPNPREQLYRHVLSEPLFAGSTIVDKGAWYVPTRRPLDSMVGNGILIVGDAACQVNPIHGGGIGPSMIGGTLAGTTAAEALEKGDVSRKALWSYNKEYMKDYGAKQAGLEIFRILLQNADDEEISYGMQYGLLTEDDILKASLGEEVRLSISEKAKRIFRGLKKPGFLRRLKTATDSMGKIRALYRNYPETAEGFRGWKEDTAKAFGQVIANLEK
ncbi:MAG: NAD(P)/FAD-dependent oxidoreductase [Candidatus Bathyarchaeota archaeon]|nr:NAD(P)/FAD-dependent oxidoreductase [Candidatus Bathyarchaeota archaeon]